MADHTQDPLAEAPTRIHWKMPLWMSIAMCVAAWWFFFWFTLAASDIGYEPKDIPDIIQGAVGVVALVATIELIRAIRRRLWKEPDIWIDPTAPGTAKTWALTGLITIGFKVVGFYLLGGSSKAVSLDDLFRFGVGAPFWAAFIVWMWCTPKPEPRGVGFYALFGIGLLTAAAFSIIQLLLHPALIPGFWASVDATGVFIQALVSGHKPAGA